MADEMNKNIDNEEIDLDALEDVSGGVMKSSLRSVFAVRRIFSAKEIDIIKESFPDCDIKPNVEYSAEELNTMGLADNTTEASIKSLKLFGLK